MSRYSHEHHVRAPQQSVLKWMEAFFHMRKCLSFDVFPLPEDSQEREALADAVNDDVLRYVIAPTDAQGWTILWAEYDEYNQDELMAYLSKQLHTTALYGHDNDQVCNERWIHFEDGFEVGSYWYLGREEDMWANFPELYPTPPGAMLLREAFAKQGRLYYHFNLYLAIGRSDWKLSLPLDQFRLVCIGME
ncbi:hypothetical protein KDA_73840 [Dictyobacter alpinus]|uniref:Uncharacterized protein n=1 Tax=Dictyobacter alpinus TaxID=2014873 RepID=A0A402BKQ5_9CHLR|nr:hypothetical protein [Dictyobacter alpinus]GCE31900.1 hypothetical protein KDA_73840 [Dictyobacter alpinus]